MDWDYFNNAGAIEPADPEVNDHVHRLYGYLLDAYRPIRTKTEKLRQFRQDFKGLEQAGYDVRKFANYRCYPDRRTFPRKFETLLLAACKKGDDETAKFLLNHGADPLITDGVGRDALFLTLAVKAHYPEYAEKTGRIVAMLKQAGVDFNQRWRSVMSCDGFDNVYTNLSPPIVAARWNPNLPNLDALLVGGADPRGVFPVSMEIFCEHDQAMLEMSDRRFRAEFMGRLAFIGQFTKTPNLPGQKEDPDSGPGNAGPPLG